MASINELIERIHADSSEEIVTEYLEKIEKSKLNAFITVAKESALLRAKEIDSQGHDGPLAGIPIAIKDNISTKGIATTCASKILTGYIPPYDAHVIEKLKEAGAIIIGKANMDEFAMGSSTETSFYGPTLNPWDTTRVPGGSSGGSAAAVAGGEAPLSLGSDTGGSVRCPASFCGVVGLKPTYGVISRYGLISYANSLEQIGPFATSVRDVATLFDVISGHDPRDSTSVDRETNYSSALINDVKGLKIGVPEEYFAEGTDKNVEKSVRDAINTLEELGATSVEVKMPHTKYALSAYYVIAMSEASSNLARFDGMRYGLRTEDSDWHTTFSQVRAAGFGDEVKRRILLGTYALSAGYHDKYYLKALKIRTLIKQDFERAFRDADVLIAPTMPYPAFKLGEKIDDPISLYLADVDTVPINLAGVPSISLPCGFSGGLPIGMQVIGKHFDEAAILRTAFAFEENTDFHTRQPEGS
ncbi:amidase [Methanosarcinales archaeon]|uniref:Asp-tRNA(Asn)/Glu-tRNA(Gln) amidotransferase subunit GatA n=1 Tax=Candidatus Methanoperedens sp. BLZ2 TaxID=2035255 RepID=UPI000BE232EC|nr:Asp-tRNA(Asn)/Glu-tRNA(Gln) amidotransferase subunit GatA [Candidatus Methanoperedens sp. BLZ2]KAB2943810.1 MAG: Asp-tRNA(Asn)/Glu-tRNA(Gln) amidotransferase subunit GatA [Candidatus Methanoperedens sp.]MBZ0177395.1 Asp-tRNA(Asn)/Glu-tRNA(Gln) amidotransferase subunit GatA [Candidatus Methanoperedens nitroreducens]MCX9077825.1 Asp-tRNA(Asn)/Glu-tRNA(Gln) amidotransferase subunit GatA [Candidatus Methanoperedens sp.]CAG0950712.1 amidase [Methanosarcinales archaeon]